MIKVIAPEDKVIRFGSEKVTERVTERVTEKKLEVLSLLCENPTYTYNEQSLPFTLNICGFSPAIIFYQIGLQTIPFECWVSIKQQETDLYLLWQLADGVSKKGNERYLG